MIARGKRAAANQGVSCNFASINCRHQEIRTELSQAPYLAAQLVYDSLLLGLLAVQSSPGSSNFDVYVCHDAGGNSLWANAAMSAQVCCFQCCEPSSRMTNCALQHCHCHGAELLQAACATRSKHHKHLLRHTHHSPGSLSLGRTIIMASSIVVTLLLISVSSTRV